MPDKRRSFNPSSYEELLDHIEIYAKDYFRLTKGAILDRWVAGRASNLPETSLEVAAKQINDYISGKTHISWRPTLFRDDSANKKHKQDASDTETKKPPKPLTPG